MDKRKIKELINKNTPTIFEIGCADGKDTQDFINTFSDLEIYCFEPEPKNIEIVKSKEVLTSSFISASAHTAGSPYNTDVFTLETI